MEIDDEAWLAPIREVERDELERGVCPRAPPPGFSKPSSVMSARMDSLFMESVEALLKGDFNRQLSWETGTWSPPPRRGTEMLTEEQMRLIGELRAVLPKARQDPPSSEKSKAKAKRLWNEVFQMDLRGEGADFFTMRDLIFNDEE